MSSLTSRLLKTVKSKNGAEMVSKSGFYTDDRDKFVTTNIPMLNVALSGDPTLGLGPGVTVFAGESKRYKSKYGIYLAKAFQDKFPDGVVMFYDAEFGITMDNFTEVGMDTERIVHIPTSNVEELKFNMSALLEDITKDDKVFILVDSISNIASKKEVDDSQNEKAVADMTKAKQMASLFRIITAPMNIKGVYSYFISGTYKSQDFMPTDIVKGGTASIYAANTVVVIGKSQEKENGELKGWNFKLNINKSRYIKEKSVIDMVINFDGGIQPYSGLAKVAEECGIIEKVRKKSYHLVFKKDDIEIDVLAKHGAGPEAKEFWDVVFENSDLREVIMKKYKI